MVATCHLARCTRCTLRACKPRTPCTHVNQIGKFWRIFQAFVISDLSCNSITHITSSHSLSNALINLIVHNLQRNYIFEISRNVFPLPLLESLHHLDLRYNSIECSCDLSENFGRWLSQRAYYLSDRPSILPRCSYSSVGNFGGCVKCTTAKQEDGSLLQQSLLQFSINSFCSSTTIIIYTASFTTFCLLLLVCLLTAEKMCLG